MKKLESINIGEDFQVMNGEAPIVQRWEYKTLYECYDRPSDTKEYIYEKYERLLHDNCEEVISYGVRSYNTFMITLHADVLINGVRYYAVITPSYNKLYRY